MLSLDGYGTVYTPSDLSLFVADELLKEYTKNDLNESPLILDPACGESSLIDAVNSLSSKYELNCSFLGIDCDNKAIEKDVCKANGSKRYRYDCFDTVLSLKDNTYWKEKKIDMVIANPPWSSERIYKKEDLIENGYSLVFGQYDSYVLFIELSLKVVKKGGLCAFILPDSIFSKDSEKIRRYLCTQTKIKMISRLGEKIFQDVNRSTMVIIVQNEIPSKDNVVSCFRLNTEKRKKILKHELLLSDAYNEDKHAVRQSRFLSDKHCLFDIDTSEEDEKLLKKIESKSANLFDIFTYSRGVETSKEGSVVTCPICGKTQSYCKNRSSKKCIFCSSIINIDEHNVMNIITTKPGINCKPITIGEDIQRYSIIGEKYIKMGVDGIKYKSELDYDPLKILIRKTGMGIKASCDKTNNYTLQTVHICKIKSGSAVETYYYLGLINSSVVFYYYLKKYGESVEWKSFPYITKERIFSFPLIRYKDCKLSMKISELAEDISLHYDKEKDIELEKCIRELYEITPLERNRMAECIKNLDDLESINVMKDIV